MKSDHHKLTVQIKGEGPLKMMLVTANNKPTVKGYVANPVVDMPLNEFGKLDVGGAVGHNGYLNVIKRYRLKGTICWNITFSIRGNCRRFCGIFFQNQNKKTQRWH